MQTDLERWQLTATQPPSWIERNRILAALIPAGASVLDVGAGNMSLRELIPDSCTYQPLDCVKGCEETIIVDFNAGVIPKLDRIYDYAICSGVMEYVHSPEDFLATVQGWADRIVLTYAVTDLKPDLAQRRRDGWFNDISAFELIRLFSGQGFYFRQVGQWGPHLMLELKG